MKKILKVALIISLGLLFIIGCGGGGGGGGSNEPLHPESTEPQFHSKDKIEILPNQEKVIELNVTDNGNEDNLEYSLIGEDAHYFRVNVSTGIIYVRGNINNKNIYHFTAVAKDFVGNKGKQDITVIIIRKPIFTSSNKISVKENQIDVVTVKTESVSRVTYVLSGTDANNFNIDSSSGVVTFKSAPNYEQKESYTFKVTATDAQNRSSSQTITVTILDVDETVADTEAPVFTSANSVSVQENQTKALTVKATDINSISYTLSGRDANSFTINSTTGVIIFKTAPNYETKKSYSIIVTAKDSKNNSATQTITITILDVKEIGEVSESDYFITTWKTDNNGTSNNNQITIPTNHNYTYNYSVDWGDGSSDKGVSGDITHTYDNVGTYTVKIFGEFPSIMFAFDYYHSSNGITNDAQKILSIKQWGNINWKELYFAHCLNLIGEFTDVPNLNNVVSTAYMFAHAENFNTYIGNWDTSNITNMSWMFRGALQFNQDIGSWNTNNVTDMNHMFQSAENFNQDISNWKTSKVTNMSTMFCVADKFNQNIGSWDVSNVTTMSLMFNGNEVFNQNLNNWNVTNVTNMRGMFYIASAFNGDISSWDVSNVTNMSNMFKSTDVFNQDISQWDVSNVTDMSYIFSSSKNFNQDISQWDVSSVINMREMFQFAENFNQNISQWDVSNVTNMESMFKSATSFNQNLNSWDVSKVTTMKEMFSFSNFNNKIENWDVSNVRDMSIMFSLNHAFSNHNLSSWNVSNITNHEGFSNGWGTGNTEPNWNQ